MSKTYSESVFVRPTECDLYGRMRPDALFIAMQEGGERHAISLGFGYDALMSKGLFFVLARIHLRTFRAPRYGETIVHTTWPGVANRFFFPRFHTFALGDGTPVAHAGSLWVLLDAQNRRIVSPAKVDIGFPNNSDIPAPIELPMRLPPHKEFAQTFTRVPSYTDYDINGHVNNTRYIAWLSDALGIESLKGRYIGDLIAGYEKEIRATDPLSLSFSLAGDDFSFRVASSAGENHFVAGGTLREEAEL